MLQTLTLFENNYKVQAETRELNPTRVSWGQIELYADRHVYIAP